MATEWRPITDYETAPADLADRELVALSSVWLEQRAELEKSSHMADFVNRLKREWAIETGLIERIYTLDRGIAQLMIEKGVDAALIPHRASQEPELIVAMIGDQQAAVESLFAFVKGNRPLSASYIKELHSLFTRHQSAVEGQDQFGRTVRVSLLRGDYKRQANNPTRPDGTVFAYCPPEHVAAEMDRLVEMHARHGDAAPEVEAAWLHHRFTQIHPFQDGNGRIARALATLIFIKANWLPLVVRDLDREAYIAALEKADEGQLRPLVAFFAKLQRKQFIKALGIARDLDTRVQVETLIQGMKQQLAKRRMSLEREWRTASDKAARLQEVAAQRLNEVRALLEEALSGAGDFEFSVDQEPNEGSRSHWFQKQIVSTAKRLDYYANMKPYRSWLRLVMRDGGQANLLISFHCLGYQFQGVLACSATWFLRVPTDDGGYETGGASALSDEVFQINYKEPLAELESRFQDWLEVALDRGLARWKTLAV